MRSFSVWPKGSPIGRKDLGVLHSHMKLLPSGQEVPLTFYEKVVSYWGWKTEASLQELGDILRLTLTQLLLLLISRIREIF